MSTRTERTISSTPQVVPANRFLGTVHVDRLEAQVRSLACYHSGEMILLIMNGPRTAVSAIAATLHNGGKTRRPAHFTAARGEQWDGPELLYRMTALGSGWITSSVEPTTQVDVAIMAHGANMDYCCQNPLPQPQRAEASLLLPFANDCQRSPSPEKRPIPPLRYLLANEGAEHPDWMTFIGLMRTFWLPFPPAFAPLLWTIGLQTPLELAEDESTQLEGEHCLIEPVECTLGIAAWQILPARQWQTLLERISLQAMKLGL